MIVVDTNVVSELMKESASPRVMSWWDAHAADLYITAVTQAEILLGIDLLSKGKRRAGLEHASEQTFQEFDGRILPFDHAAAREFARIAAVRRKLGRPISYADAQIAAIARSCGSAVATRNTGDFAHCGIRLLNPWS